MRVLLSVLVLASCTKDHPVSPPLALEDVDTQHASTPASVANGGLRISPFDVAESAPDTWTSGRVAVGQPRRGEALNGAVVTVWTEATNDTVTLWAQWGEAPARPIDRVVSTPAHAEQSARSLFDVAVSAHGSTAVGVAWRPLVDSASPQQAELRWGVLEDVGAVSWQRQSLVAHELGFTTGVGPYAYADARLRSVTLGDQAVFVWVGDAGPVAAGASDPTPSTLGMRSASELQAEVVGDEVIVTGYDYWCDDGTTHSSSCRSMDRVRVALLK